MDFLETLCKQEPSPINTGIFPEDQGKIFRLPKLHFGEQISHWHFPGSCWQSLNRQANKTANSRGLSQCSVKFPYWYMHGSIEYKWMIWMREGGRGRSWAMYISVFCYIHQANVFFSPEISVPVFLYIERKSFDFVITICLQISKQPLMSIILWLVGRN